MHWEATALTDRGRVRRTNEDAFLLLPDRGLFAVADGMGGHASGEVASEMAVQVLEQETAGLTPNAAPADVERALANAVHAANRAIYERAAKEPQHAGMGTTLTALALLPDASYRIAHVGDSRAYRIDTSGIHRLTTDHTWVQEQIELGRLTEADARRHPLSSVLTRALGIHHTVDVDLLRGTTAPGDLLLLASDGLTSPLTDDDIRAILEPELPLDELASRLVQAANLRGGPDNITVVLIRVTA
ncbi:MAG TPA: Stp1/IreP family PP2C-type Ser/Thr phosphatase [Longimicrobiales bacterium]